VPEKVIADSGSAPTLRSVFSGRDRQGNQFSQILFASGGMGASATQDGHACMAFPTNTGAGSIEAFESISPLIVWRKELRPGSGGAGKHRGGLGQEIEVEVVSPEPLRLSLLSDRQKHAPKGFLGGGNGATVEITLADGTKPHPKSRSMLKPGTRLIMKFSGGGGYGNPAERTPEAAHWDVKNEYVLATPSGRRGR